LIGSLLKQLVSQLDKLPSYLSGLYDNVSRGQHPPKPDLCTLVDLFVKCSKDLPSLSVILDAFDECHLGMREKLIPIIQWFYQSGIKVCITTQSWLLEDLKVGLLKDTPTLAISADKRDVECYLEANLPKKGITRELRKEIINKISCGVGEMYDLPCSSAPVAY
jgi:hypothetical protein